MVFWIAVATVAVVVLATKFYYQSTMGKFDDDVSMRGKTVIVTGSNTGIGKATALDLAKRGARVILACRDLQRAKEAKVEISEKSGNSSVIVMKLDLSTLESVREFVQQFLAKEDRLDVLVNNAAAVGMAYKLSKDGMQQELQVNHFGPFLLTILLIDILKKSSPSRVVVVSSLAHKFGSIDFDNLNCERSYPGTRRNYANAKLANVLFANELARRLEGTGVTVNSVHPGLVNTEIARRMPSFWHKIYKAFIGFIFKSAEDGAKTVCYLAVSDKVRDVTGKYFADCKVAEMSEEAKNEELAKTFWVKCVELVKLQPNEICGI
ncbi:retinol dehydrogenase 14-like [Neocloeon triangulifer]|uniref:retinol dehydrogenase 14-like n=1 Tax=Neocloeon triangulifer TaxID=2078957 RepID=UPI00286F8E93|nr:retinol dehydrogenase 14-like [Neocloeon triangulifer]XP_059474713.1 retinol dehydrogenase 14-like [Neocloeon triangulifer]